MRTLQGLAWQFSVFHRGQPFQSLSASMATVPCIHCTHFCTAGILWAGSVGGSIAYQWNQNIPRSLKIIHARVYAQVRCPADPLLPVGRATAQLVLRSEQPLCSCRHMGLTKKALVTCLAAEGNGLCRPSHLEPWDW